VTVVAEVASAIVMVAVEGSAIVMVVVEGSAIVMAAVVALQTAEDEAMHRRSACA
jgi:hypothetical protein